MINQDQPPTPPSKGGFQSEEQIRPLLGVSRRTLKNWRDRGLIPYVKLPGSRRILFDWPSVQAAILRQQRGGEQ
jgi:predicted site-specific integrase-resolvase